MSHKQTRYLAWIGILATIVLALMLGRYESGKGLTALIQFDEYWAPGKLDVLKNLPHHVRSPTGYDGQFYVQIAMDPLITDPDALLLAMDSPTYRGRRILVPAMTYTLGLGKPGVILYLYPWINYLFWIGLCLLMLVYVNRHHNHFRGMVCLTAVVMSTGAIESIRLSLVDLPFAFMALLAIFLSRKRSQTATLSALAATNLTRVTGVLVAGAALFPKEITIKSLLSSGVKFLVTIIPLILWLIYLDVVLEEHAHKGLDGNLSIPFTAIIERIGSSVRILQERLSTGEIFTLVAVVGLLTQFMFFALNPDIKNTIWRLGAGFAILMVCLGPSVWAVHMAVCRTTLPMTLAFNILLMKKQKNFWPWLIVGNAFSVYGILKFIVYSH